MKGKTKTLGLALAAVLALSAVVASAASAAPKLTPESEADYPVTVKGEQVGANVLGLEGGRKVECTTATFEGTIANKSEAEESKLTVTPVYEKCTATILGNKDPATITMNGCDYLLTTTETTSGAPAEEGWEVTGKEVHLQCPSEHLVEVHVYANATKHANNEPLCTYHRAPQIPVGDLRFKVTEKNTAGYGTHGSIGLAISGVTITKTSGTVTNCGAVNQTASLTGEVTVRGFNAKGEMIRTKFED